MGSLTGGLFDRLQRRSLRATVADSRGNGTDAVTFASTVERAAAGLSRRGTHPGDVVGILAPVSPDRLTAVYTVMAAGGIALPLELASDLETLIDILTAADVRMILVTAPLAGIALELADRSRVRQVIAFGRAPETTPFGELLLPSPDGSGYDPARGLLFHNGLLCYETTANGVFMKLNPHAELLELFHRFAAVLELTPKDTVVVEPGMPESARAALAALALWNGSAVVTTSESDPDVRRDLAAFDVTVRGGPAPVRVGDAAPRRS